jgi:hypothetical protein
MLERLTAFLAVIYWKQAKDWNIGKRGTFHMFGPLQRPVWRKRLTKES